MLAYAASMEVSQLRYNEAMQYSLEAIDLAGRVDDPRTEVQARYHVVTVQTTLGDLEGARGQTSALLAAAERLRDRFWLTSALWKSEIVFRLAGEWDPARELAERGSLIAPGYTNLLADRVMLESEVGNLPEAEAYLGQLRANIRRTIDYGTTAMVIAVVARITGLSDQLDIAQSMAETVLETPSAIDIATGRARTGLALVAVERGDVAAAAEHYALMEPRQGTMVFWAVSADRVLGLLVQTMGNLDQAAAHFEDALAFCRKAGYRPELAWTCCDYSDLLRERDTERYRAKVITLLDESLAISSELGMRPLMERVLSRKLELQGVASIDLRTSIDAVASAVTLELPDLRPHTAPDGTVTILFSDIEGFTQMTERLGDQRAQQVLRGHNSIVRHQVAAFGGFEVKALGDGFMLAFSSARRALQCAMAIQRAFAAHNREHTEEPVRVRIGLHTGEFVQEMDDFFGKNVILASRIADQAQGGEILVSSLLKELTESAGDIRFGEEREVELKGLTGLNRVYAVAWE
jgi:class 3 adenylate cyclase